MRRRILTTLCAFWQRLSSATLRILPRTWEDTGHAAVVVHRVTATLVLIWEALK